MQSKFDQRYEALRDLAESGNIAFAILAPRFRRRFDLLPHLDESSLCSAVSKHLGHFPEGPVGPEARERR
jgi:hypothetical protein